MELMLVTHAFPEFQSPHGFLRARACWVLHYFSDIKFKNPGNLKVALDMVRTRMCEDKDLPVKVEAAIALQMMLSGLSIERWDMRETVDYDGNAKKWHG